MEKNQVAQYNSYDKTDPKSIESYAKALIGHTFNDVLKWDNTMLGEAVTQRTGKGAVGTIIEEHYFHYKANSDSRPDFPDAGVELKVSPYEIKSNNELKPGERLVLTMIQFNEPVEDDLYNSHLWEKCKLMLLIYYLRNREIDKFAQRIDYVSLFTPPAGDLEIIKQDYNTIIEKIRAGKAHELSESDTLYLGACTKGATADTSWTRQYYSTELAKRRAFCFKTSYMKYVLNNYLALGKVTYEEGIASAEELRNSRFADILQNRVRKYVGMDEDDIAKRINIEINKGSKSYEASLVYSMLGVTSTHAEEFEKAGIIVRVIKYRKAKANNQQFRLLDIDFVGLDSEKFDNEVLDEEGNPVGWENSRLYDLVVNQKYFFAVFWEEDEGAIFKGCQLWNMPEKDVEIVKDAWTRTKLILRKGINFSERQQNGKIIVENNLPGMSDNGVFHIRPHASKTYYEFSNGRKVGTGSISDSTLLPNGERMTKQSYWLNRSYIDSQINDDLRRKY